MSTTLNQLVRNQILAEGPQHVSIGSDNSADLYVQAVLNNMPPEELLERISDALELIRAGDPRA